MRKSIIIFGAGLAGLSSGCYAQMNRAITSICEMHNIPGGLCTAWKRKGFTFDISMHMLTASMSGPLLRCGKNWELLRTLSFIFMIMSLRSSGWAKNSISALPVFHHSFDPSMAPAGKSVVEVWFDKEFEYWENCI